MSVLKLDIDQINQTLREATAEEIVRWAMSLERPAITSTSFGTNAAVMLHLVNEIAPGLPTVWIDTGYNLRDTYVVAERLTERLDLNVHVFSPEMTSERRNALMGGIPTIEDKAQHQEFTRQVKLEPFARALQALQPEVWLTGIRREETEFRKGLDIVSVDARGILKVAPLFYWTEEDVEDYMIEHALPSARHYFDPTKVHDSRECGLHTAA